MCEIIDIKQADHGDHLHYVIDAPEICERLMTEAKPGNGKSGNDSPVFLLKMKKDGTLHLILAEPHVEYHEPFGDLMQKCFYCRLFVNEKNGHYTSDGVSWICRECAAESARDRAIEQSHEPPC